MNQLDIYCFTSIARTQSFSITARELMISQQAVSNHIKTLEEEVGYTLFFRYGQNAVLTKAGEFLLDYFIRRDKLMEDFFHSHQIKEADSPFLLAWTQWVGCPEIPRQILSGFRKEYPDDKFLVADMAAEKMKKALKERKIDILFTSQYSAEYMSMSWEHTFICKQEIFLIRSNHGNYQEEELEKYPFFAVPAGESNEYAIVEEAKKICSRHGFVPRYVEICEDIGSAYINVITRNGLSLGTENTQLLPNSSFSLSPMGVYVDYIMCSPYYTTNPSILRFKNYVKDSVRSLPHRPIKEAGQ